MTLNKKQKATLVVYILLVVVIFLFPPRVFGDSIAQAMTIFRFIFIENRMSLHIDAFVWITELLFLSIITCVVLVLYKDNK